ncbi:hypothetical protein JL721_6274 [Aureococcus anophagefferens]|nr:hypothetical protein JL721_6274 [Aureococcus anophagefferens]
MGRNPSRSTSSRRSRTGWPGLRVGVTAAAASACSASCADKIAWYMNDGSQNWELVIANTADEAWDVHAIDLDGDGDVDALSFTKHVITTLAMGPGASSRSAPTATAADVLAGSWEDETVAWYENMHGDAVLFSLHVISPLAGANAVYALDLDGDGDADVSGAALAPGGVVSAAAGAVRAGCVPGERCDCYAYSAGSVKVAAPAAAAPPGAVVTGPSTASACEALVLHSDSSTGSGGRAWASIAWNVTWDDGGGFEAEGDALEFAADQLAAAADRGVRRPVAARFWVKTIENRHGDAW